VCLCEVTNDVIKNHKESTTGPLSPKFTNKSFITMLVFIFIFCNFSFFMNFKFSFHFCKFFIKKTLNPITFVMREHFTT
jgi:hypothetical protein